MHLSSKRYYLSWSLTEMRTFCRVVHFYSIISCNSSVTSYSINGAAQDKHSLSNTVLCCCITWRRKDIVCIILHLSAHHLFHVSARVTSLKTQCGFQQFKHCNYDKSHSWKQSIGFIYPFQSEEAQAVIILTAGF